MLQGTGLEQYSKQLGFGLYVVKGAVEPSLQEVWTKRCDRMMEAMAEQHGANSVRVRTCMKKHWYASVQGVVKDTAPPSCYGYPGIQHDPVVQLDSGDDNEPCGVLVDSLEWLHDKLGIATHQGGFRSCQFNSVVANKYEYGLD